MSENLKEEQILAINSPKNLLVSANAGSGKTFVMLKRCVHLVCEKNFSVLDFLLITFTDAAASQMRTKLFKELTKKYNEKDLSKQQKLHIKKQIGLLPLCDISTIHTFCFKIIKKYFYAVNLNAGISICDQDMSNALLEKAMTETINFYSKNADDKFFALLSTYDTKRNFSVIKEIILKIFKFSQKQIDKHVFKNQMKQVYENNFEQTPIAKTINDGVVDNILYWKQIFEDLLQKTKLCQDQKLEDICSDVLSKLSLIKPENSFRENHAIVFGQLDSFKRMTKSSENLDLFAEIQENKNLMVKDLKKIKEDRYLSDNLDVLQQDLFWCKENVFMLIEMEEKFEEIYSRLKRERNMLDFADLEKFALKILENEEIAKEISKSYKQIFVDEYQDVNDIQEAIINKIWINNTLFLVGDPKQSIYRFRNTNPQIMIDKMHNFNDDSKQYVELQYNFRSQSNILNFVNYIFSKIMTDFSSGINYKQSGMFKSGVDLPLFGNNLNVEVDIINENKEKAEKTVPEKVYSVKDAQMHEKENLIYAESEGFLIASKIADMIKNKEQIFDNDLGKFREITFRDIVLIFRYRGAYLDKIIQTLESLNIPVKTTSPENVLEEYEVAPLFAFLKLLETPFDDYALTTFLTSAMVGMTFDELSSVMENSTKSFSQTIFEDNKNKKIVLAKRLLNEAKEDILNGTIYEVLVKLLTKTNYENSVLNMADGSKKLVNVFAYINDFLSHNYNNDLVEYLSYVENMESSKTTSFSFGENNAISIFTMHQSKGLEFPIVFLVDTAHQFNQLDQRGPCLFSNKLGIGVQKFDKTKRFKTNTISRSAIVLEEIQESFAEELRVLYVGLTRAKNKLFVIGKQNIEKLCANTSSFYLRKQNNAMSIMLSALEKSHIEALKMGKTSLTICSDKTQNTKFVVNVFDEILATQTSTESEKNQKLELEDFCEEVLENIKQNNEILDKISSQKNIAFKNSVSRILELETQNINPAPKRFSVSESGASADKIGTAFHKAMELVPFELDNIADVKKFLQENLSFDEFNLIDCDKILKCLNYLHQWTVGADKIIREGRFYLKVPHNQIVKTSGINQNILIQGVVDLVIQKDGQTILVDFKTTREKNDEELKKKYEVQMECYKIAIENALKTKVTTKILYSFFKDCAIFC